MSKKLSQEEAELLRYVGVEAFKFLVSVYKSSRAKGVDLVLMLERASEENEVTVHEV